MNEKLLCLPLIYRIPLIIPLAQMQQPYWKYSDTCVRTNLIFF